MTKVAKSYLETFVRRIFQNNHFYGSCSTFSVFDTFLGGSVKFVACASVILSNAKIVLSNMTVDFDRTAHCQCNHQCLTELQQILTEQ